MRLELCAALVCVALTAACSRTLTPNETAFAKNLFGDTIEVEGIEVLAGVGVLPIPRDYPALTSASDTPTVAPPPRKAPDDLCVRKPSPRKYWDWPAAFVLDDNIYFSYRWFPADAFEGLPQSALYPVAPIMAHELVHVWQWQNRERTNYSPLVSAGESIESKDPYFWVPEAGREFLSYGYEQQAAIVEDLVCYTLFDPKDPKLDELADILRPILPVDRFIAAYGR
ncbi:MAG: hypothetical protein VX874_10155 [Pseudomonadota bacterium]|nr:hypothetical protein [Pseudomonadota bacterium]